MKTKFYTNFRKIFGNLLLILFLISFSKVYAQSPFVTAVCHNITIALDSNGKYTLTATNKVALSQGSITPQGFKKVVCTPNKFDCSSIPGDSVEVKVYDLNNNFDVCYAYVTVRDIIPPKFTSFPDSIPDIVCYEGMLPEQEVLTGTDECGTPILTARVDPFIEDICNGFPVTYRWILADSTGNRADDITVSFDVLPDTTAPHFDFMPDSIPDLACFGDLQIQQILTATDDNCRQVEVIPSVDPYSPKDCASYEIVYRWSLSDECGNAAEDVIRTYQILPDTIAPNIVCPSEQTFILGEVNIKLFAFDNCSDVEIQYKIDFNNDGVFDRVRSNNVIEGDIPLGTHSVLWTVNDACGNMVECTHLFNVESGTAPNVVCKTNLAYNVNQNGCIRIAASDLMDYATDLETEDSIVEASVKARIIGGIFTDSLTFCCLELGISSFELKVEDEHGNIATCTSSLIVGDNQNFCASHDTIGDIKGRIVTINGDAIPNVTVNLGNTKTTKTNSNGYFKFKDLDFGKNYTLFVQHDLEHYRGISTSDVIALVNYVLIGEDFVNPLLKYGADVTRDGRINVSDIVALRKVLLKIDSRFSKSKSWSFFKSDFDPIQTPFSKNIQELFPIKNFSEDTTVDFIGVKTGDVNGDVIPTFKDGEIDQRSQNNTNFIIDNFQMTENESYNIDFRFKDFQKMDGFQMALNYNKDEIEILDINEGVLPISENYYNLESDDGIVYFSWNGDHISLEPDDVLFSIKIVTKSNTLLENVLSISSRMMDAELYQNNETFNLKLQFVNPKTFVNSVFPNPFSESTRIFFENSNDGNVDLQLFNTSGQLVYQQNQCFEKGMMFIEINKNHLPTEGLYIYKLSFNNSILTGKLLSKQ